MKSKTRVFVMMLLLVACISSCKKNNPVGGSMSLKVDGSKWSASLAVQAVNTNGVIMVTGSDASAFQVSINLLNATGPGTFDLGPNGVIGDAGRWTEGTNTWVADNTVGSGSIVVTDLTATNIKGTFEFTASDGNTNKVITEGKFDATF